jgi:hypothetical protein
MPNLPDHRRLAEQLLKASNITAPPVKLATVAQNWRCLQVTVEDIDGEAFLVDLGALGCNILVRKSSPKERQRFSLAHELGHLVLMDSGVPIDVSTPQYRSDEIERWCNEFASELLMPTHWLKRDVSEANISRLYFLTHEISQRYLVSAEAALIRLSKVAPVSVFRITVQGQRRQIKNYQNRETSISFEMYKPQIFRMMKATEVSSCFSVDTNLYCQLHAQYISPSKRTWVGFLVRSRDGVTVDLG